jgi:chromosome partitioning protein
MKILTLLNEKGGVGKTTLTVHIAAGLALQGFRVLVIDADPQGHASVALGVKRAPGLYNLLVRNASYKEVLVSVAPEMYQLPGQTSEGSLWVLPSNEETRVIPMLVSDGMLLVRQMQSLQHAFDVVLIDTSPTPSLLHSMIYIATDAIVYPTECEYLSLDGLSQSLRHRDELQKIRSQWGFQPLDIMGIVPTKYRASTLLHNNNLERLRKSFGDKVWGPLALATIWGEASAMRRPVFQLAPDSKAAQEMWNIVTKVQEELVS